MKLLNSSLFTVLLFVYFSVPVFAEKHIFESFIATETNKIELIGGSKGGQFGADIVSGDINGDGYDDIVVGSPFSSSTQREWNGTVSVIFGKSDFEKEIFDFNQVSPDILISGENSGDQLGSAVALGDYNNDGFDDIAVGAFNAKNLDDRTGKVYIFYGRSVWGNQNIDLAFDNPSRELIGKSVNGGFGLSLDTMDLNNDSIDDLFIGAPFVSTSSKNNAGAVYVYSGTSKGLSSYIMAVFYGLKNDERFGSAISGGDINGDGSTDVVIGAYHANNEDLARSGKAYIYTVFDKFPSAVVNPTHVLEGLVSNSWFGFSVDVGDINGDLFDDIAVGSFPYSGDKTTSRVSVYHGSPEFDYIVDTVIDDPINGILLGANVLLEDINSDGKAEIIVGAPGINEFTSYKEGNVYLIYSNDNGKTFRHSIKNKDVTSIIYGEKADDWFGYDIENLDFNGDGFQDLAVGSRYSDSSRSVNNGKVFILFGNNKPFGSKKEVFSNGFVTRAEFISYVIKRFDLKNKRSDEIKKCKDHKEFCLFNFLAMSSYEDIKLDPNIVLYPDIPSDHPYFEDITIGTMLGLINGYLSEEDSPFRPEFTVSRIHALKIVLGAAELVPPKYRFELINILGSLENLRSQHSYFSDVDPRISHMWWYPRYVNFAVEKGILDNSELFRPDDNITWNELNRLIDRTLEYINSQNA
ncbi:hypothetical protein GF366_02355 [Candidatus Peregrinibacteria bacterium]|nr:hypothetical protein [Candidatus Peregrinibacteria bacterium]